MLVHVHITHAHTSHLSARVMSNYIWYVAMTRSVGRSRDAKKRSRRIAYGEHHGRIDSYFRIWGSNVERCVGEDLAAAPPAELAQQRPEPAVLILPGTRPDPVSQ